MATMTLKYTGYNVYHFHDGCGASNNHTILVSDELVVDGGGITSQAKSNGSMCRSCAISSGCLVCLAGLIEIVFNIGSRYVCLDYFFELMSYLAYWYTPDLTY